MRLLVFVLDIKYLFKLYRNICCCCCELFGAQTLHNELLADLKTKLIEMILPSRSPLKFSIDDDKLGEGLMRMQTTLL